MPKNCCDDRVGMKQSLKRIAQALVGIAEADLTKAERQIANVLVEKNFLKWEESPDGKVLKSKP